MNLSQRVKAARKHAGLTQRELAKAARVEQPLISQLETGKTLKSAHIAHIAKACRVSALWLASGEGEMTSSHAAVEHEHSNVAPALQPRRGPRAYPLISWVAAGERAESPDNYYPGDGEELLESTENAGEHGYWLRVKGKSMTSETPPSFPPDTPILVRPEGFDVISGKFYIAKHRDGETTFKQYVRDAGTAYLVPLNPAFNQVEMDDEWRLIGRVVDAKITGL